jgi:hypothetical protein
MQVSVDGLLCCTISSDHSVKIYDVVNYDMMFMMRLPFVPGAIEWVYREGILILVQTIQSSPKRYSAVAIHCLFVYNSC